MFVPDSVYSVEHDLGNIILRSKIELTEYFVYHVHRQLKIMAVGGILDRSAIGRVIDCDDYDVALLCERSSLKRQETCTGRLHIDAVGVCTEPVRLCTRLLCTGPQGASHGTG